MRKFALHLILLLSVTLLGLGGCHSGSNSGAPQAAASAVSAPDSAAATPAPSPSRSNNPYPNLPHEAVTTLQLIQHGGPFPYERDGIVFQNRERQLPPQPRGYYHEYTVVTPGSRDRGARRIIAGGNPPKVFYYTDDHYRHFQRIEVKP